MADQSGQYGSDYGIFRMRYTIQLIAAGYNNHGISKRKSINPYPVDMHKILIDQFPRFTTTNSGFKKNVLNDVSFSII